MSQSERREGGTPEPEKPGNRFEKALTALGFDVRTARNVVLMSGTVLVLFMLLLTGVGFAGRNGATPKFIDWAFNITDFVDKSISEKSMELIDSGYSQLFEIHVGPDVLPTRHTLVFYARQGQDVELTVSGMWANYENGRSLTVPVKVDGAPLDQTPIKLPGEFDSGGIRTDITECLRANSATPGLHEITIDTDSARTGIRARDRVFVKMIVLVRRNIPEGSHNEVHNAVCKSVL